METIYRHKPKANKEHKCSWCNQIIKKGHHYDYSINKFEGVIYTWKNHFHCAQLANKLNWFEYADEGLTGDDFIECAKNEYIEIMVKTQPDFYESKDFVYPKFSEQLELVLRHYQI